MLYIGLMSGTSADGIDGVLVDLEDNGIEVLACHSSNYSPGIQDAIESVVRSYPEVATADIEQLDVALGRDFAAAARELANAAAPGATVTAIGSHGQTIYHGPDDDPAVTIQLGRPQLIADLTGLTTVADFRRADLEAGGQGAPLAPAFHSAVFRDPGRDRVIVNIGGIANLTCLPADPTAPVRGFDTGPGNTLMDQWCVMQAGRRYDAGGRWAAKGRVVDELVDALLGDPYFQRPAPKSTGREYFHLDWIKRRYPSWREPDPADIQASLLEVTARSIIEAAARSCGPHRYEMYVCGGGARNAALMDRLGALTGGHAMTTDELGLSAERVEACTFAWLAHRRLHSLPGNLPSVTGASREVLLGTIHLPA